MDQVLLLKVLIFFLILAVLFLITKKVIETISGIKKESKNKEYEKAIEENDKENFSSQETKKTKEQKDIKISVNLLILIVLTIGVAVYSFSVWSNYQKENKQYQACVDSCKMIMGDSKVCESMCDMGY